MKMLLIHIFVEFRESKIKIKDKIFIRKSKLVIRYTKYLSAEEKEIILKSDWINMDKCIENIQKMYVKMKNIFICLCICKFNLLLLRRLRLHRKDQTHYFDIES